jgi:formate dehydrogenase subunit delta
MANQIARNFAVQGEKAAVLATADHIATFWDPRMKAQIFADSTGLEPIAERAIVRLRAEGAPPHQTAATIEQGGSDAG